MGLWPDYLNNELLELQKDRDHFIQKSETRDPEDKFTAECMVRKARNKVWKAQSDHCLDQTNKQNPKRLWYELQQINPEAKSVVSNLNNGDPGKGIQDSLLAKEINN